MSRSDLDERHPQRPRRPRRQRSDAQGHRGKFIGRALCLWGGESQLFAQEPRAGEGQLPKLHGADPEMVVQACIFEIVTTQVEQVPVPEWGVQGHGPAGRDAETSATRT